MSVTDQHTTCFALMRGLCPDDKDSWPLKKTFGEKGVTLEMARGYQKQTRLAISCVL